MDDRDEDGAAVPVRLERTVHPGDILAGRYRIVRALGRGGMASVFLAQDRMMRRSVVVKLPRRDRIEQGSGVQILREMRALSRLSHPGVVSIFDVGEDGGQPFLVLEFLQGRTLREMVDEQGPMGPRRALALGIGVAEAVAALHAQGYLHLDLTAGNVMLTRGQDGGERTRVIDFGLAMSRAASSDGRLVGTPYYVAPEQILGHEVGARADVYALGVLLYFALSGRHPFEGPDARTILRRHLRDEPPRLGTLLPAGRHVPRRLLALVHACLQRDPLKRPDNLEFLAEDLREVLGELGRATAMAPSQAVPGVAPAPRPVRRRATAGVLGMVLAALVGMGLAAGSAGMFFLLLTAAALGVVATLYLTRPPADSRPSTS